MLKKLSQYPRKTSVSDTDEIVGLMPKNGRWTWTTAMSYIRSKITGTSSPALLASDGEGGLTSVTLGDNLTYEEGVLSATGGGGGGVVNYVDIATVDTQGREVSGTYVGGEYYFSGEYGDRPSWRIDSDYRMRWIEWEEVPYWSIIQYTNDGNHYVGWKSEQDVASPELVDTETWTFYWDPENPDADYYESVAHEMEKPTVVVADVEWDSDSAFFADGDGGVELRTLPEDYFISTGDGLTNDYSSEGGEESRELYVALEEDFHDRIVNSVQLLKIWCEAKCAHFTTSPLTLLKNTHTVEQVKHHIKELSYAQVKELEVTFGNEFISTWKSLREQQITIGKITFTKKHNQYFMTRFGNTTQFTNFTMEISHIEKDKGEFFRVGHIYCKDHIVPFKIKAEAFISHKAFMKELTTVMFESGTGIPIVATNHQGYLIDVINLFNVDVTVQMATTPPPPFHS